MINKSKCLYLRELGFFCAQEQSNYVEGATITFVLISGASSRT